MNIDLDHLRTLLRDVPQNAGFTESIRLLEDAFDYAPRDESRPIWWALRCGPDVPFFGKHTLRALLGKDYLEELVEREYFCSDDGVSALTPNLRLAVQRFVVLGLREGHKRNEVACVLFHAGEVSFTEGAEGPPPEQVSSMDLVRVRAGLMNRRQAYLLASHLNRFRRSKRHGEQLTWVVVRGPVPDSSARRWLDEVGGKGLWLSTVAGESPEFGWGWGPNATRAVAVYITSKGGLAARHQVFADKPAHYILPPRWEVSAKEKTRSRGIPEDAVWKVTRNDLCPDAYAIANVCELAGLITGFGTHEGFDPGGVWGRCMLLGGNDFPEYGLGAAEVYATSFSRQETGQVMRGLRAAGYQDIRAFRVGAAGHFGRQEYDNPYLFDRETHVHRELAIAGAPSFTAYLHAWFTRSGPDEL